MNRGHKMRLKRNRAESLGCHDRHPLPRVCLREPRSRDVINWQWPYVIRAQIICSRNNRYLHDVPSISLWKTVQHRQDYQSRWLIKFRTQYNTKTGPQTDDVWHILWRQREREAVATYFLRRPYATPEWRCFNTPIRYMGLQLLCLPDCIEICPYFWRTAFWFWNTRQVLASSRIHQAY